LVQDRVLGSFCCLSAAFLTQMDAICPRNAYHRHIVHGSVARKQRNLLRFGNITLTRVVGFRGQSLSKTYSFPNRSCLPVERSELRDRQNESNHPCRHSQTLRLRHHQAVLRVDIHVDGRGIGWLLQSNPFTGDRSDGVMSVRSQANDDYVRNSLL